MRDGFESFRFCAIAHAASETLLSGSCTGGFFGNRTGIPNMTGGRDGNRRPFLDNVTDRAMNGFCACSDAGGGQINGVLAVPAMPCGIDGFLFRFLTDCAGVNHSSGCCTAGLLSDSSGIPGMLATF